MMMFLSMFNLTVLLLGPISVLACGDSYHTDISRGHSPLSNSLRNRRDLSILPSRKFCSSGSSVPASRKDTTSRLQKLREKLSQSGLVAYLVPSTDGHQSEYVAEDDMRRAWISGFTGSNGFAVVTTSSAAMWLDGRYYIQGEEQLDCNWILMRSDEPNTPDWWDWLAEESDNETATVGADPALTGAATWLDWEERLARNNITLKSVDGNIVDSIWDKVQNKKSSHIDVCREEYAGRSWTEKVKDLLEDLNDKGASAMVVTALDEIAWLFNIRGEDIPYSPVVKAYALITQVSLYIYLAGDVSSAVKAHLNSGGCEGSLRCVIIKEYANIFKDLAGETGKDVKGQILLGKPWAYTGGASFAIYNAVEENKRLLELSPIMLRKAQKNEMEIKGMENANIKDAVALIAFCAELENGIATGEEWDELKASKRLLDYRNKQNLFKVE